MAVGVRLPGAETDYISTTSGGSLMLTTEAVLIFHGAINWQSLTLEGLISNILITGDGYGLYKTSTTNRLVFTFRNAGVGSFTTCDTSVSFANGEEGWVKVTYDDAADEVKFYESDDGVSWSQLGATKSNTDGAIGTSSTEDMKIGLLYPTGSRYPLSGTVYGAEIYSDVAETTLVAEWSAPHTGTRYRDSTGKIWTVNGANVSTVITA